MQLVIQLYVSQICLTHMQDPFDSCPSCNQSLFFVITANVEIDGSVAIDTTHLTCNIPQGK